MLEMEFGNLEESLKDSLSVLKINEEKQEGKYKELRSNIKTSGDQVSSIPGSNQLFPTTPFLLKHSFFISTYSLMEYFLKNFCEIAASELSKHKRRVSNFEKVHQFYSFLIDEIQLDKNKTEGDWKKLNIFRDIRNSIIHYNSSIGKNISPTTYIFLKEDDRIEFQEPRGFIIKDVQLIYELLHLSKRFLLTLIDDYHQRYFNNNTGK
jgi:hypothetical protein